MAVSSVFLSCREPPDGVDEARWASMDKDAREKRQLEEWLRLRASGAAADREKVLAITALPNLLEDIAGMYNRNLLDRAVVKTGVEAVVESVWGEKSSWWFLHFRSDPGSNTYQDLVKMVDDLKLRKRPRWHRPRDGRIRQGLSR
jgi:hypothetical protein